MINSIVQCPTLDPVKVGDANARGTVHSDVTVNVDYMAIFQ
jgi:hypothetical protein